MSSRTLIDKIKKCIPKSVWPMMRDAVLLLDAKRIGSRYHKFNKGKYEYGVNLIGPIKAENGLGQSCRLLAEELKAADIPFGVYEYYSHDNQSKNDTSCDEYIIDSLKYEINIFHVNASDFSVCYHDMGISAWKDHYNIAFWLWELEEFPKLWANYIGILDEVWTPSEFISRSIRRVTNKPVITIPYHVDAKTDEKYGRDYFNLPKDKFLFLMMYDGKSILERKNPLGALEAFKKAFDKDNNQVGLVIKVGGNDNDDVDYISSFLDGYNNIYFLTDHLSKIEVNSLVASCDVFVSLHRAEGFGLVMAEAMLNGTPCIATNWSANTEFMSEDSSCMVDYNMTKLDCDIGPYKKGNRWAEPAVQDASEFMKKLYGDNIFYKNKSIKGKDYIYEKLGMDRIADLIINRLKDIEK